MKSMNGGDKVRKTLLGAAVLVLLQAGAAWARGAGASFLKIPSSAKAQSFGPAYAVMADDVGSMGHNPAGLANINSKQFQSSFGPHLQGYRMMHMAYGQNLGRSASFGFNMLRLAASDFDGRDANGNKTGSFKAEDRLITLAMAKAFHVPGNSSLRFSLGAAVKHLQSSMETESAQAMALDIGFQAYDKFHGKPAGVAFAVRNMGSGMKFLDRTDPLPLSASLAAAYEPMPCMSVSAFAENGMIEQKTEFGFAMGYSMGGVLDLRASLARPLAGSQAASPMGRLSGGIGVRIMGSRLDYAFTPMGDLGSSQRVSLTLGFGGSASSSPKTKRQDGLSRSGLQDMLRF